MKWKNTVAVLALLPPNAMIVGWVLLVTGMTRWAASYDNGPYEPPVADLAWTLAVVAVAGGLLAWRRLFGAAVFQAVLLLFLTALVMG